MLSIGNELSIPSLRRPLQGLSLDHQTLLLERYKRLLPALQLLLEPRDIVERNRTWPGVRPGGNAATRLLSLKPAKDAHSKIRSYALQQQEHAEELWQLLRAYCRYGPVGLIEALHSSLPQLVPEELQEFADFHRFGKHPRSDAGMYIRELLNDYAARLDYPQLPHFVARLAFANDRRRERWYVGEHQRTEHVATTSRRLNLDKLYEHRCWATQIVPLPMQCQLSLRQPHMVQTWLVSMYDVHTTTLMGFRVCARRPTFQDILLCLRWSIWHFDAPWWGARGIPDRLLLAPEYQELTEDAEQALHWLRCSVGTYTGNNNASYTGFPETFTAWLGTLHRANHTQTLADVTLHILNFLHDASEDSFAVNAPILFRDRGVSLPCETSIAAALLLPSFGHVAAQQGTVDCFGVPFDAAMVEIADGQVVDVRYDPDDARSIYLIINQAHVKRAPACAFEHRVSWSELCDNSLDIASPSADCMQV